MYNSNTVSTKAWSYHTLDEPNDYCEYCGDYVAKEYNSDYGAKCELLGGGTHQPVIEQNDCCIIL
jgi:hypothetical protein